MIHTHMFFLFPRSMFNTNSLQAENVLTSQPSVVLMFVKCEICVSLTINADIRI